MKRKLIRDWEQFVDFSSEFLIDNMYKVIKNFNFKGKSDFKI